jgi:hypothetical protein
MRQPFWPILLFVYKMKQKCKFIKLGRIYQKKKLSSRRPISSRGCHAQKNKAFSLVRECRRQNKKRGIYLTGQRTLAAARTSLALKGDQSHLVPTQTNSVQGDSNPSGPSLADGFSSISGFVGSWEGAHRSALDGCHDVLPIGLNC